MIALARGRGQWLRRLSRWTSAFLSSTQSLFFSFLVNVFLAFLPLLALFCRYVLAVIDELCHAFKIEKVLLVVILLI